MTKAERATGKRGPARQDPTPDQKARFAELKERAHRISLLSEENELFRTAAALVRCAQAMVHAAMDNRHQRGPSPARPERNMISEIVALEDYEREVIAYYKRQKSSKNPSNKSLVESLEAEVAAFTEPINRGVRAALCLLRYADNMLREEVRLAGMHEEVSWQGETEKQILDHLVQSELGFKGFGAARLEVREELEDAVRRQAERREKSVRRALDQAREHFMAGFAQSGAKVTPQDQRKLDQLLRQAATVASADPRLDDEIVPVNAFEQLSRMRRRTRNSGQDPR
jgi:hypothetical protein